MVINVVHQNETHKKDRTLRRQISGKMIFSEREKTKKESVLIGIENATSESVPERELGFFINRQNKAKHIEPIGVTTRLRKREHMLSLLDHAYGH